MEARFRGKLNCKSLCHSIAINFAPLKQSQSKIQISLLVQNQIDFILRRCSNFEFTSISMPSLVAEPSTRSERSTFICALLPALSATLANKG